MRKVLVTGAGGFIGQHLVKALLQKNIEVFAIVYPGHDVYKGSKEAKLHVKYIDLSQILNYVKDFPNNIDVLYHFAWGGVQPKLRNNIDVQMANINMTLDCMKFAAAINIRRVVFPGSTNEYLYYGKPINDNAVPSPSNAYGAAKIALRYLCNDFARRNGIAFLYAIIAGIYGADRRDGNVIFYTIDKLLRKEKPSYTRLEQLWDYVYIDDVIDALVMVGEKGRGDIVYAIGHGDNWKLSNYIKIIHQIIDPSVPLGIGEIPYESDVLPSSCIDLANIKRDTGWEPKINFNEGIDKVICKIRKDMENERK